MTIQIQLKNLTQCVIAAFVAAVLLFNSCPKAHAQAAPPQNTDGQVAPVGVGEPEKITLITVQDGATQTNMKQDWPKKGNQNWGCVKKAGSYVEVKVTTQPDTQDTWDKLQWNTGEKVPGGNGGSKTNNYRRFSRATPSQINVKPLLSGSGLPQLQIWVMWAKVSIQTSGVTPQDAVHFGTLLDGTEALGARSYSNGNIGVGKIVAIGEISPPRVHKVAIGGWDFHRSLSNRTFEDGVEVIFRTQEIWGDDTSDEYWKTLKPNASDKIYDTDGPNITNFGGRANSCVELYYNFRQHITWNNDFASDTDPYPSGAQWHWRGKWQASGAPEKVVVKEVGGGYIDPLPTTSAGCP